MGPVLKGDLCSLLPLRTLPYHRVDSFKPYTATNVPCEFTPMSEEDCPFDGMTEARYISVGVGSYNPKFSDEITFYTDHIEYLRKTESGDNTWVDFGSSLDTDVLTLKCSKLNPYPDGKTIVCDINSNLVREVDSVGQRGLYIRCSIRFLSSRTPGSPFEVVSNNLMVGRGIV